MNISDEAVEAAAKAYFENCDYAEWEFIAERVQVAIRADMRAALEAAAPHMQQESQAAAWDEGYLVAKEAIRLLDPINPYRSQS